MRSSAVERLQWAIRTAKEAHPGGALARLRLLWHDFILHGLLNRGGERCQNCGRSYDAWHADDDEWLRVMGSASGLLCALCFAYSITDHRPFTEAEIAHAQELSRRLADG